MSQHIKTHDGYDVKVPTQGQVDLNTVLGALGTASFAGLNLQGLLGGLLGGGNNTATMMALMSMAQGQQSTCSDDHCVNRYELSMQQELASKDTKIALLESNIYTDSKITQTYRELNEKITNLEAVAAKQAVQNQGFADAFRELSKDIDYKVNLEAERRECADNKIICYANGTFAPKLIADYTAGTTTTAMTTFNPLCCCSK